MVIIVFFTGKGYSFIALILRPVWLMQKYRFGVKFAMHLGS